MAKKTTRVAKKAPKKIIKTKPRKSVKKSVTEAGIREVYVVPFGFLHLPLSALKAFQIYPVPKIPFIWPLNHCCDCCCCCHVDTNMAGTPLAISLDYDTQPYNGKAILITVGPGRTSYTFALKWDATGGSGQVTVDLEVEYPGGTVVPILSHRGPSDHYLYSAYNLMGGSYVFKAIARDSAGNTAFDTLTITL